MFQTIRKMLRPAAKSNKPEPENLNIRVANSRPSTLRKTIDPNAEIYPGSKVLELAGGCSLQIGGGCKVLGATFVLEKPGAEIIIGERTGISTANLTCSTRIFVGNDVLISWDVFIVDHDSHSIVFSERSNDLALGGMGLDRSVERDWTNVRRAPIHISDKVWIGLKVIIMKGVTIGEGAIIGAGAVVTRDVPPWSIVFGNPARVVMEIPEHQR